MLEFLGQFLASAARVTRANEARRTDFTRQVKDEHAAVLAAIEASDAGAARRAAARHMVNAARRIRLAGQEFWRAEGDALAESIKPRVKAVS